MARTVCLSFPLINDNTKQLDIFHGQIHDWWCPGMGKGYDFIHHLEKKLSSFICHTLPHVTQPYSVFQTKIFS